MSTAIRWVLTFALAAACWATASWPVALSITLMFLTQEIEVWRRM